MAKPETRKLVNLRKALDVIEADLAENRRLTGIASQACAAELGLKVGEERLVRFSGDTWKLIHNADGIRVILQSVDESV